MFVLCLEQRCQSGAEMGGIWSWDWLLVEPRWVFVCRRIKGLNSVSMFFLLLCHRHLEDILILKRMFPSILAFPSCCIWEQWWRWGTGCLGDVVNLQAVGTHLVPNQSEAQSFSLGSFSVFCPWCSPCLLYVLFFWRIDSTFNHIYLRVQWRGVRCAWALCFRGQIHGFFLPWGWGPCGWFSEPNHLLFLNWGSNVSYILELLQGDGLQFFNLNVHFKDFLLELPFLFLQAQGLEFSFFPCLLHFFFLLVYGQVQGHFIQWAVVYQGRYILTWTDGWGLQPYHCIGGRFLGPFSFSNLCLFFIQRSRGGWFLGAWSMSSTQGEHASWQLGHVS